MATPEPTRKTWGISIPVYRDNFSQIEKIHVYAGGYSSIHLHHFKANRFLIESGRLIVRVFSPPEHEWTDIDELKQLDDIDLRAGEGCIIYPGDIHSFHAAERTTGLEVYYLPTEIHRPKSDAPIDPHDIERFSTNGVGNQPEEPTTSEAARICAGCWKHYEPHSHIEYQLEESNGAMRPFCNTCIEQFQLGENG